MANVLPPFPSFSIHEDNASVGPRWMIWLKHSGMYLVTHDVKDATPRERCYYTPLVKTLPDEGDEKDYAKAVGCFEWLFSEKEVNKAYEIYMAVV